MTPCIIFMGLAATVTALTFDCVFFETEWMGIGLTYQCQTKPFNIESTQYLTNATGTPIGNNTNDDVAAVLIHDCTDLSYIPKGLLHFYPNLLAIYLYGCGISSLSGTELNEYPGLKLFALEWSPLRHVPGNFFSQNPDVFFISFNYNQINSTGRNLIRNLKQLSEIYFENNTCINANATTIQEVTEFSKKLNQFCSIASEMPNSITIQTLLLSALVCIGNYFYGS